MLRRWRRVVAVGVALILDTGCRSVSDEGGRHSLPPAPPGTTDFSDYQPDNPYEPSGDGVAERSVFTSPSDQGYAVEVRDVMVAPGKPQVWVRLDGAAVLEVRQGSGEATMIKEPGCEEPECEEKVELYPGFSFTVDAGKKLRVTASDEPLELRTWIVSAGGEP